MRSDLGRLALALVIVASLVLVAVAFYERPEPVSQPQITVTVVAGLDAAPADAARPDAMTYAALMDAAPVKRAARAALVAPAPRGQAFRPLLGQWFSGSSLVQAQGIVADLCDQELAITDSAIGHIEEEGPDKDRPANMASASRMLMDERREARKKLAQLPGARFDSQAWNELSGSDEYRKGCSTTGEDDE